MPLIGRLSPYHTIREFRAAAGMRFREGQLPSAGDRLAAIYLWGYTAEMLLKAAYFRLRGWLPSQPITITDIQDARKYAMNTLHLMWYQNLHDLSRWRELLVEERKHQLIPYPWVFLRPLNARVTRIYRNWREHLRYRTNRPYQGEVVGTFQAVSWLIGQYRHL